MSQRVETFVWNLGIPNLAGDLQVQLLNPDGTPNGAAIPGLVETSTDGSYQIQLTLPANFEGSARLESVSTSIQYPILAIGRNDVDGFSWWQLLALIAAPIIGKSSGFLGGNPVNGAKFRSADDTVDRVTANTDATGNRTSITLTPPT